MTKKEKLHILVEMEVKEESAVAIDKKGRPSLKIKGPSEFVLGELRRLDAKHEGAPLKEIVPVEVSGNPNPRPPSKN